MSDQTRTDFWKCDCTGHYLRGIHPISETVAGCCAAELNGDGFTGHATRKEVFATWISADDERRKEIEVASIPEKEGDYWVYTVHFPDGATLLRKKARVFKVEGFDELFCEIGSASAKHEKNPGWFWEPAT